MNILERIIVSDPAYPLLALTIGRPVAFRAATRSAIAKRPVHAPIYLGRTGFAGDRVADRKHHGGSDKAVHHYPRDHYDFWRTHLGGHALLEAPGAFGENIATLGLTEKAACIGDRYRLGEALIQVSHGRQPCWKLDHRFGAGGKNGVMHTIVRTGRCGLYFRVIEDGMVAPDDAMVLTQQGAAQWTVERVFRLLIGGQGKNEPAALRALRDLDMLADVWRLRAGQLLE